MTVEAYGQNTTDSAGTQINAGGSPHTKGPWVELAASTSNDNEWLTVTLQSETNDMGYLVDIGVGAAASEAVVVANIPYNSNGLGGGIRRITLPITIPAGSRVAARCQAVVQNNVLDVSIHLSDTSAFGTAASSITIGADTTTSLGTTLDAGASANAKGAWAELDASTSEDIDYFVVLAAHNRNTAIGAASNFLIDIGTGAAASETVLVANIPYNQNIQEQLTTPQAAFFEAIASGTRVAARCQSTEIDATDRIIDVVLVGCNMTAPAGGGGGGGGIFKHNNPDLLHKTWSP